MSQDGSKAVAVGQSGIACSIDSGTSWHLANGPSNSCWLSVAGSADGSKWVAAAVNVGVFCSVDNGVTWHQTSAPTNTAWSAVSCSADGVRLLAAADPGLIYASADAGATWTTSSVPAVSWKALASSSDGVNLAAASAFSGIYISTNSGLSWRQTSASTNESWGALASASDGMKLVAGGYATGISTSVDGGANWAQNSALTNVFYSLCSSADGSKLAAAVYGGGILVPGVSSAFSTGAATYQGLFFETNGIREESSGFFTASTSVKGKFSAKLQLAGKSYSFSGVLPASGFVTNTIKRAKTTPLTVVLGVGTAAGELGGLVGDGVWTAQIVADIAAYSKKNAAPQAGRKYTLVLPGTNSLGEQVGTGFGSITADVAGKVTFTGALGEGTKISQSTYLSSHGQWPFYASLYSGSGSILGWLTFTNETDRDIGGSVIWIKPVQAKAGICSSGLTNAINAMGSLYTNSKPALNYTYGQIRLDSVNGRGGFTNRIKIGTNNMVTNLSSNQLKLTLTASTGLFNGSVADPITRKPISFQGALLQKQNLGLGCFPGTNQSGTVRLEVAP